MTTDARNPTEHTSGVYNRPVKFIPSN